MSHKKWYCGFRADGKGFEGFHTGYHDNVATPETHPDYVMIYGPYKTDRASKFMCKFSTREMSYNRIVQDFGVPYIEKLAKQEYDENVLLFDQLDLFNVVDKPKDALLDLRYMMD